MNLLVDLLTQILNGSKAKKSFIYYPKSIKCGQILNKLIPTGIIVGYRTSKSYPNMYKIFLPGSGFNIAKPHMTPLSKPSRRVYVSAQDLWKLNTGLSVLILSTSKGIISDKDSRRLGVGGEAFCIIK